MNKFLRIGLIVKPQGIRGEVKVLPLSDDSNRFRKLKEVFIDEKPYKVLNSRVVGNEVFVSISGFADRNSAELLRGKYMCVDRANAIEPSEGHYFIADIINSQLLDENEAVIGKIVDITQANTDIFTVQCNDGRVMRFPFLKKVVFKVDVEFGKVFAYKNKLEEVCVYED
ncbi:MAG: 16S rRNA processing protein RimM [Clostridia bacterium]|nr:16S rRNA processing protein RimM [Clostridia bacterium]